MNAKATVLLVDDHAVVRAGFRYLLESKGYIVKEVGSAEDAYKKYQEISPDVVVLDISMPGMGGIEGLRRLRAKHAQARVLLLSMYDDPAFVSRAIKMGAQGFISKNSAADSLSDAIAKIISGEQYFSDDISQQMQSLDDDFSSETCGLSAREFEVFRLLAEGRPIAEIAEDLKISPKTVSNHRSRIMEKTGLKTTAEIVRFAIRLGISKA